MDFKTSVSNLRQLLPELDFFAPGTLAILSSNLSNDKKIEQLVSNHFAAKKYKNRIPTPSYELSKEAQRLHAMFPSVSFNYVFNQLRAFEDMPARQEIVLRLIIQRTEQNGLTSPESFKRVNPAPYADYMNGIKVRKLAELQPSTSTAPLPPSSTSTVPLQPSTMPADHFPPRTSHSQLLPNTSLAQATFNLNVENQGTLFTVFPKPKPSATITSEESNQKPEPFLDIIKTSKDYSVPDILEHFDLPIVDVQIPVGQNCTITSSSVTNLENHDHVAVDPEAVLPQNVAPDRAPAEQNARSEKRDSQDSNQTEIYTLDVPPIGDADFGLKPPDFDEPRDAGLNVADGAPVFKVNKAPAEDVAKVNEEGGMGPNNDDLIDFSDVGSEIANMPSTSRQQISRRVDAEGFDLIAYVREITDAPLESIRRHCEKHKLPTNVKPTPRVLNRLVDDVMAIVLDSEDSDVEENLTLMEHFAIAEEIIAEDSSSSEVKAVDGEAAAALPVEDEPSTNPGAPNEASASSSSNPDMKLVKHLCSMFSDACPKYIKGLCRNKTMNDADLNDIITVIISADNNYPKRPPRSPEPELPPENQLEILKEFLPDADPDYLRMICDKYEGKGEQLRAFLVEATEKRNYPTMKDYQRRQQLSAQQKQYTTEFSVENFIKVIPDPVAFFADPSRNVKMNNNDAHYTLIFMRNRFKKLPVRTIQGTFHKNASNIAKTMKQLEFASKQNHLVMKSTRKTIEMPNNVENIPLLQELAYYTHQDEINEYLKQQKEKEEAERTEAKNKGLLKTCTCCYDEEVLPRDIYSCEKGCEFCKSCIVKGSEVRFGEGKLDFPCLMSCGAAFTLQTLQAVLSPKLFSKIAQKKALEEIKAAGIEDLEACPFCDFATIPAEGYTIFTCMNPECMKESCRMCKEPSHVPLHCDEIEKDEDVKARTFLEDKMTEALLKKCYKCGVKFFKEEGCNKMTCSCGAQMCYVCGQPVTSYKHFNGNGGDRYDLCPLYSDSNVLNKENVLKGVKEAKEKLGDVKLKHDPTVDLNKHYEDRRKKFPQQHLLMGQPFPGQPPPVVMAMRPQLLMRAARPMVGGGMEAARPMAGGNMEAARPDVGGVMGMGRPMGPLHMVRAGPPQIFAAAAAPRPRIAAAAAARMQHNVDQLRDQMFQQDQQRGTFMYIPF